MYLWAFEVRSRREGMLAYRGGFYPCVTVSAEVVMEDVLGFKGENAGAGKFWVSGGVLNAAGKRFFSTDFLRTSKLSVRSRGMSCMPSRV
jgi:hypothetical protein